LSILPPPLVERGRSYTRQTRARTPRQPERPPPGWRSPECDQLAENGWGAIPAIADLAIDPRARQRV